MLKDPKKKKHCGNLSYSISPPILHFFVIKCSSCCQKATCMAKSFQVLQNEKKKYSNLTIIKSIAELLNLPMLQEPVSGLGVIS